MKHWNLTFDVKLCDVFAGFEHRLFFIEIMYFEGIQYNNDITPWSLLLLITL